MRRHPEFRAYGALVAVCFFWGTTYLAIRMALESFPPLLLVALRFMVSGSLMVGTAMARGVRLPAGRELAVMAMSGTLILGVGNGCLTFAEMLIPSGMAGLILSILPFWMVVLEAAMPQGEPLHGPTVLGMLVGLGGAALLFAPDLRHHTLNRNLLSGFLILQAGMASWAFGSIYQRRRVSGAHPVFTGAVQQLAAGLAFTPLALFVPEHPVHWSWRGVGAILYLVVFGSIVGYSAYAYALDKLPVAIVSIYPYVNTVVAVILGWLFYREPFGANEAAAMAVIFLGVAIVKRSSRQAPRRALVPAHDFGGERASGGAESGGYGK